MNTLNLTIYKQYFDEIRAGTKKEEYRIAKPYWIKRLRGKHFDQILFRNGYSATAPRMIVECLGITEEDGVFIIKLGDVLGGIFTVHERLFYEICKAS